MEKQYAARAIHDSPLTIDERWQTLTLENQPGLTHELLSAYNSLGEAVFADEFDGISMAINAFVEFNDGIANTILLIRGGFPKIGDGAEIRGHNHYDKAN
jgi:hypothetical protein